ncbi:hypothetical protein GCM10027091_75480 [Streptomyces daliensis]
MAVVGAVPLLAGCGSASASPGPDGATALQRVLADPDPDADEIIEAAGAPSEVARATDGSLLLAYYLRDEEGGEDGAVAWRVYGPDGEEVAEHGQAGYRYWQVHGVGGGFVFAPKAETEGFFLDVSGQARELRTEDGARAVRKGDVLVNELEPTVAYRPSAGTLAPLGGLPDDNQHTAVDRAGTTWSVPMWGEKDASVAWLTAKGERGRHTFGLPEGTAPQEFAADGGTAAVTLAEDETAPDPRVRALVLTTDAGATWRTLTDSSRLPLSSLTDPALTALRDGRLLIGERDAGYWLADTPANASFHRLETPAAFDEIVPLGRTLYGIADGEGMWTSKDGGRNWAPYEEA